MSTETEQRPQLASQSPVPGATLHFGIVSGQHQLTFAQIMEQWRTAEALGFDSAWLFDHFYPLYGDPDGPCLEASTLLAALARETSTIRIGVLVYGNTHRHPAILAKELATLDHVSDGRLEVGIGTGWNEREHATYGIPFPSAGERVARLDETLAILHSAFTDHHTIFHGRYYQLEDAPFYPKPLQAHVPILVGGSRSKMLRVIARHADIWDCSLGPQELAERARELEAACVEVGRDPQTIVRSVSLGADQLVDVEHFAERISQYQAAGVTRFLFDFPLDEPGVAAATTVAKEILPELRRSAAEQHR